MPTENRRVATYLPKEIDDRLEVFKKDRDLTGDSPALIAILSEFFGVSVAVAHPSSSNLSKRVEALESQIAELMGVLTEGLQNLNDVVLDSEHLEADEKVNSSSFVKTEQLEELITAKVSELITTAEKGSSPNSLLSKLPEKMKRLEERINDLEAVDKTETLSSGELAKRLGIDGSTLSHWKSSGAKGKSPDEMLKATRDKDPDGIGWIYMSETKQFKPEKDLPNFSGSSPSQGELLSFGAIDSDQVSPLPVGSERSGEG